MRSNHRHPSLASSTRRPLSALAAAGLLAALAAPGCAASEGEAGERALAGDSSVALASAEGWRVVEGAKAPAGERGEPAVACGERDLRVEGAALELSTGACNYALLGQPSLADVFAGDEIVVRVWWGPLDAPAPATARVRLFLGLQELFEEAVAVPGRPDVREAHVKSLVGAPAGTPMRFEVANHGANSWNLGDVTIVNSR